MNRFLTTIFIGFFIFGSTSFLSNCDYTHTKVEEQSEKSKLNSPDVKPLMKKNDLKDIEKKTQEMDTNQETKIQTNAFIGTQEKVDAAYQKAFEKANVDDLTLLYYEIIDLEQQVPENLKDVCTYWKAYLKYEIGLVQMYKLKDSKAAEKNINECLEYLNTPENANSEFKALLSLVLGFSGQFHNMSEIVEISKQSKEASLKAIELDENNLRGYYGLASVDFYVPEMYGGGKLVESNLLKAISIQEPEFKMDSSPYWGKDLSYNLLIDFYLRKDRMDEAKSMFKKFEQEFPSSYYLVGLRKKIEK